MMYERMSEGWWSLALRGVVAILLGIAAFAWPGLTVMFLVAIFGVYALVDGVLALAAAAHPGSQRGWLILEGIIGVIAGILCFVRPGLSAVAILYVIAAWAIITGIAEIAAAVQLRRHVSSEWLLMLTGIVSIVLGIVIAARPVVGLVALAWAFGTYGIIFGVLLFALAMTLHNVHHAPPSHLQPTA